MRKWVWSVVQEAYSVFYAVGVLIISPTVGGCGLSRLRSNVDSEGGKYTSAIASVYLPPSSSTLRWSCTRRKASTPRLRLGVLAFLLVQLQLKYASSKFKSNSASPRWTWTWTRRTWEESVVGTSCNFSSSPPRQVQVQLGFASLNLDLTQGTWAESAKFTSPRCRTYTSVPFWQTVSEYPKMVYWQFFLGQIFTLCIKMHQCNTQIQRLLTPGWFEAVDQRRSKSSSGKVEGQSDWEKRGQWGK